MPVNFHLTAGEIEYIAGESGARLVFVDSATEAGDARGGRGLRRHGGAAARRRASPATSSTAFVGGAQPIELDPAQRVIPNLLFTSGTTGRPKAVQLPPKTIGDSPDLAGFTTHITAHRMASLGAHLVIGPLYHNGPLTSVRLLLAGVPVVVHGRFDAEGTLRGDRASTRSSRRSWCRPTSCGCSASTPTCARGTTCRRCAPSPTPVGPARST